MNFPLPLADNNAVVPAELYLYLFTHAWALLFAAGWPGDEDVFIGNMVYSTETIGNAVAAFCELVPIVLINRALNLCARRFRGRHQPIRRRSMHSEPAPDIF